MCLWAVECDLESFFFSLNPHDALKLIIINRARNVCHLRTQLLCCPSKKLHTFTLCYQSLFESAVEFSPQISRLGNRNESILREPAERLR